MPLKELYRIIRSRSLLYPQTPLLKMENKWDRSWFCKFDDTHDHTTAQYCDLRNQVEDLVRNQYLNDFIVGTHPIIDTQHGAKESASEMVGKQHMVRVITGGPTLAENSNRARKNYSRYDMSNRDVLFNLPTAK